MRWLAAPLFILVGLLVAAPADARPRPIEIAQPPPPPPKPPAPNVTLIEWTTWLRAGIAVAHGTPSEAIAARVLEPPREHDRTLAGAAGVGVTLPVGPRARIGAWAEVRGWQLPLVGGELTFLPGDLDMFFYKGKSVVTLRAGGNPELVTAQLGLGYRAPWDLFGAQPRGNRYTIGANLVATFTQSRLDRNDWSATVGIEFEPLGALRYLLGIRSWY